MNQDNYSFFKRIALIIVLIIILLIAVFFYYMFTIEKDFEATFDQSKAKVIEETDLKNISSMHSYQEEELFHIFIGKSNSNEDLISVVHLDKDKKITSEKIKTFKSVDYISEESMLDKWAETCNQCDLIKIQAAYTDDFLLWEITYNDIDNRYVFDYYLMTDGKQFEELKLNRNFN